MMLKQVHLSKQFALLDSGGTRISYERGIKEQSVHRISEGVKIGGGGTLQKMADSPFFFIVMMGERWGRAPN